MKFGVVVFPGSNCDRDCYYVVDQVLGHPVSFIWHQERSLAGYDCVILPGGFSYGDYLRSGAIARFAPIMDALAEYVERGGLVLGICNGFQILLEAGLLPGAMRKNDSLQFCCRDVYLRVENNNTPFTNRYLGKGEVIRMPVAHGEGSYYTGSEDLQTLEESGQVIFRYCDIRGEITPESNPNGSLANIAGICNQRGNVLGMMPHPERCAEEALGYADGVWFFQSILNWWDLNCEGGKSCG